MQAPNSGDQVWVQIHSDLTHIYANLRLTPDNGDALRAFESMLRLQAAAAAAEGLDALASRALESRIASTSREQVEDEVVRRCQRHRRETAWRDVARPWLRNVLHSGYTPALLDAANAVWNCAAQVGERRKGFQAVRRYHERQSLRRTCDALVALTFILQRVTVTEPTLNSACAALALSVGIMERLIPVGTRSIHRVAR